MNFYYEIAWRFVLAALLGALLPFVISLVVEKEKWRIIIVMLSALALVGASAGIAGGMSRTAAVGDIIPAFLGLLGGVAIYLFGVDSSKGLIASFGAAALSISLIVSYSLASKYRNDASEDQRNIRAICAKAYTNADLLGNEKAFLRFKYQMGNLCYKSMTWKISQ